MLLSVTSYKCSLCPSVRRRWLSVYRMLSRGGLLRQEAVATSATLLHYMAKPPPCTLSPFRDTWLLISSPTFITPGPPPTASVCFKTGMTTCWQSCMREKWHASSEKSCSRCNYTPTRVFNYPRAYHCPTVIRFRKHTILVN